MFVKKMKEKKNILRKLANSGLYRYCPWMRGMAAS